MARHNVTHAKSVPKPELPELRPGQSVELLKALHILTRDGRMNQDSRRKLKQVYHLYQFIEPLLQQVIADKDCVQLDRKSTRLNSSHVSESRMPSSA